MKKLINDLNEKVMSRFDTLTKGKKILAIVLTCIGCLVVWFFIACCLLGLVKLGKKVFCTTSTDNNIVCYTYNTDYCGNSSSLGLTPYSVDTTIIEVNSPGQPLINGNYYINKKTANQYLQVTHNFTFSVTSQSLYLFLLNYGCTYDYHIESLDFQCLSDKVVFTTLYTDTTDLPYISCNNSGLSYNLCGLSSTSLDTLTYMSCLQLKSSTGTGVVECSVSYEVVFDQITSLETYIDAFAWKFDFYSSTTNAISNTNHFMHNLNVMDGRKRFLGDVVNYCNTEIYTTTSNELSFNNGKSVGFQEGYNVGYDIGSQNQNTLPFMITSYFDGVTNMFKNLLNFEVFGINLSYFVCGILGLLVFLLILKIILKCL